MLGRLFGKPKQETNALATLDKLNETLEMLEKKEQVLLKKAGVELERAKDFTRAKNKRVSSAMAVGSPGSGILSKGSSEQWQSAVAGVPAAFARLLRGGGEIISDIFFLKHQ